ncbi:hypothetical protein ANN_13708 [Periplaneta americana]|uniref:Per a allergen n=1 Tax=Periplaneta americana TaxID=6978 RepID=A0ABQ8SUA1_PERAM|nr:hypothetical protein ANN_13708 [Periplaneta americana]
MVQSSSATCKKLAGYTNECHPALNFWKVVQNLDPTLAVPEKISSVFTSGNLKRFSAIDVLVEEISTYAAMVHGENSVAAGASKFWSFTFLLQNIKPTMQPS